MNDDKLNEARKMFPEKSHLDNRALADFVYENHYSHAPKSKFYEAMGLKPTMSDQIYDSFMGFPSAAGRAIAAIPGQAKSLAEEAIKNPKQLAKSGLAEVLDTPKNLFNAPYNIAQYFKSHDVPWFKQTADYVPHVNYDADRLLGTEKHTEGEDLLRNIIGFSPISRAGKAAKGLSRVAQEAQKGVIYAAGKNQDPIQGAGMASLFDAAARTPSFIRNRGVYEPIQGNLSPEELKRNAAVTQGTNTPLGDVIQSPILKKTFENITSAVPFSGGSKSLSDIKGQVENAAHLTMNKLEEPHFTGDLNETLKEKLVGAFKSQQKSKNELYKERDKISEESNHQLTTPGFSKAAIDAMDLIEESPGMRSDPAFKNLYRTIAGLGKPGDKSPSIQDATLLKSRLAEEGHSYLSSPSASERAVGSKFVNLSKLLDTDLKESIKNSGNPKLIEAHEKATKNYKENFSPFLDKYIYKITRPDFNAESLINDSLQIGKKDKSKQIQKIQNLLPEKDKNLLGYHYLKTAAEKEGELDPKALSLAIRKLGPRQKKALFPNENTRSGLENYSRLRGMNEEALNVMFNPKTGARNTSGIIGATQLSSAATSLLTGHPMTMAAEILLPALLSKAFNKAITSEGIREKVVKGLVKRKERLNQPESRLIKSASKIINSGQGLNVDQDNDMY